MPAPTHTFSESWYRIAKVEASLRPTVQVTRQRFRGELWYVLQDPFNNRFFRLTPDAYALVSRLEPGRSVDEVWQACLQRDPDGAPGQEETIRLLAQLHHANLLYYNTPSDSEHLFTRYHKRKQRELRAKLAGILFSRIPLIDPDAVIKRLLPLFKPLFGPFGLLLWLLVMFAAGKLLLDHASEIVDQGQSVLAPDNLLLLYLSMVLIKTLHEFGHAIVCRHYGGEVHTMGVMLIVFTPIPYMDATSSWSFRSRWQRAFVGAAGMITELFIAALAVFVWANTGQGMVHSLAYNIIFIASVSTLLFNANPLLRFDGYYIFSDLVDVPNLYDRARAQLRYLAERWLFGRVDEPSPSESRREAFGLSVYGVLSAIYRTVVFFGIVMFVGDQYLILGLLMLLMMVMMWGIKPPLTLIKYLFTSPKLARNRGRAIAVVAGGIATLMLLLATVPVADHFRAPGVVEAVAHTRVSNDAPGFLQEMLVESGTWVSAGTPLLRLENHELQNRIRLAEAQRQHLSIQERKARSSGGADLAAIAKRKQSGEVKRRRLQQQQDALLVHAQQGGIWVAPELARQSGAWLERGTALGTLIDDRAFRFTAVAPQDEASSLFSAAIRSAEVRLKGQAEVGMAVVGEVEVIPFQHQNLPSAALGWRGGGEIAVVEGDPEGLQATEPFFRIEAALPSDTAALLMHGRSGVIRFTLNDQPLLAQWSRDLRQLLQRRYQL